MSEARSDDGFKASPNDIKHNERKRATAPGFNPRDLKLEGDENIASIQTTAPGPTGDIASMAASVVQLHERRWGHKIIEYGAVYQNKLSRSWYSLFLNQLVVTISDIPR